jgi:hypothetical protein
MMFAHPITHEIGRDVIALATGNDPLGKAKVTLSPDRRVVTLEAPRSRRHRENIAKYGCAS